MVSIISLGGSQNKSNFGYKDLLLIASIIGISYLLYKNYFQTSQGGGGSAPSISDVVGDTTGTIMQGAINQGSGLDLTPIQDQTPAGSSDFVSALWNFATGIWKANPLTMGTGQVLDFVTQQGINPFISDLATKTDTTKQLTNITPATTRTPTPAPTPSSKLPSTKWTTPTIPKYTTDYIPQIKESTAPDIVKAKILAGKIT